MIEIDIQKGDKTTRVVLDQQVELVTITLPANCQAKDLDLDHEYDTEKRLWLVAKRVPYQEYHYKVIGYGTEYLRAAAWKKMMKTLGAVDWDASQSYFIIIPPTLYKIEYE